MLSSSVFLSPIFCLSSFLSFYLLSCSLYLPFPFSFPFPQSFLPVQFSLLSNCNLTPYLFLSLLFSFPPLCLFSFLSLLPVIVLLISSFPLLFAFPPFFCLSSFLSFIPVILLLISYFPLLFSSPPFSACPVFSLFYLLPCSLSLSFRFSFPFPHLMPVQFSLLSTCYPAPYLLLFSMVGVIKDMISGLHIHSLHKLELSHVNIKLSQ